MFTPLVPSDLYRLVLPSAPQIAPGARVFYLRSTQDEPADRTRTAIWCAGAQLAPHAFTSGPADRLPRVSPDGSALAFVGDRGDGYRVYVMATIGGEAAPITPAFAAITALAWSPASTHLAFSATAEHDARSARIALDEATGARHIRALPFKSDDDGLLDGRRRHLFVIVRSGGAPEQLTHGDYDANAPAWSPDGAQIAFTARIGLSEDGFSEDLHAIACTGGAVRTLTRSRGPALVPAWSHDGREIAFCGHERGDDLGGLNAMELLVIPSDGGDVRSLSAALDRPVGDDLSSDTRGTGGAQPAMWSADDRELYALVGREGTCSVTAFTRDGASSRVVVGGERDVFACSRAADGTLAIAFASPTMPSEIALVDTAGTEHILTESNPWLAERSLRAPRRLRPPAADGTILDLWLLDPDGPSPAPYVLAVHGGPHMAYGFSFMFEFQMLASHGIGVAYGNPRGGQTYGRAYAAAIKGDWGGIDASDVLALLDGAIANAAIDERRIAIAGGSYGGFMTTWLLGHSKRFAAGISMRAVNDFVSEVGATDAGWFLETELDAPWTDGGRRLFETSPMRSAHAIDVPLLVEHSDRDYRCAIDQGEQLFTLLRRLGRTNVEFVRFTGDGHGLSRTGKPRNRMLRLRAIAHWLIRHLRPAGIAPSDDYAGALFAPLATEVAP